MITCKAQALQRTPLYVTGAGNYRDTHQRPVLTLPAWKLFSDKSPGSSKGGQWEARLGQGTPAWKRGTDDRQTGVWADQGYGVQFTDLLSSSDTSRFPDKLFLCSVK